MLEVLIAHKPDSAQDDDLVFATTRGGHIHPSNVRTRGLQPAIEKANRELALTKVAPISADLTPHGLRHTYCSILVSMDEDWATVAQQMRHADIATTQRYYTHAMRHSRNGIAERLDGGRVPGCIPGCKWLRRVGHWQYGRRRNPHRD